MPASMVFHQYLPTVRYEKQARPPKLPPLAAKRGQRELRLLHYMDRTFGLCIWLHVEFDTGLFGRHRYWSSSVPRGRKKLASQSRVSILDGKRPVFDHVR
jgi:hypothetical protein